MPVIHCEHCRSPVEVDSKYLGMDVECGLCHAVFKAISTEPIVPPPSLPEPKRERSEAERELDDGGFDDQPRPRKERKEFVPDDRSYSVAEEAVLGPANGLIAIGWFAVLAYLVMGCGLVLFGFYVATRKNQVVVQNPNNQVEAEFVFIVAGSTIAILGPIFAAIIVIGGYRLKELKSYAIPMTAAILATFSVMTCHPCNPINWVMAGVGIWTLRVLNRPDVKWAIKQNQRREY